MAITAAMVKELRERTGAGMMDCKNVLNEVDGDMERAIEVLREKGLAKAAKKAGRVAAEGLVKEMISADHKTAALVEINSETDFVAKNEQFVTFVNQVAEMVLNNEVNDVEALKALPWCEDASKTVGDVLTEKIATIGENLTLRRIARMTTDGVFAAYTHGGGKIIAVVEMGAEGEKALEVGRNVAMQIAAVNPEYIRTEDVSAEKQEKEKEICLLEQEYVKDPDFTVGKYVAAELGNADVVKAFVRFETGEGIEKVEENFAEEVAKQMAGN